MLEKPNLADEKIIACLKEEYELWMTQLEFLPLGADLHTAVYRAVADDGTAYFCKLRSGVFDETSVELPKFLYAQGIPQIIPPLVTKTGALRADLDEFKVIVYPFVEGQNGYRVTLTDAQWAEFGAAFQKIHSVVPPPALARQLKQEKFSPFGRTKARDYLYRVEQETFDEPIAAETASFLRLKRAEILSLIERAEQLANTLETRSPKFVLCHSDMHAGNLLIQPNGTFYIVDWDDPMLAPRERDLMFIGGGQGFVGHTPEEEEQLFYRGYGPTPIDQSALAYYRYERIVTDIAVECDHIFSGGEDDQNRAQELDWLKGNFLPDNTIELAYRSDKTLTTQDAK